jgi:hypothetical protein
MTFVAGTVLTAAQLNTYLRDNSLETAPAKATAGGQIFVSTSANTIAARVPTGAVVYTSESTSTTTYTDLGTVGPAVSSVSTGSKALVMISAFLRNGTAGQAAVMGYDISGATTANAANDRALWQTSATASSPIQASTIILQEGLVVGNNTFTAKYKAEASGSATFANRRLAVIPL